MNVRRKTAINPHSNMILAPCLSCVFGKSLKNGYITLDLSIDEFCRFQLKLFDNLFVYSSNDRNVSLSM